MEYTIEQVKASIINRVPLCGIAWGRELIRERKEEIARAILLAP